MQHKKVVSLVFSFLFVSVSLHGMEHVIEEKNNKVKFRYEDNTGVCSVIAYKDRPNKVKIVL